MVVVVVLAPPFAFVQYCPKPPTLVVVASFICACGGGAMEVFPGVVTIGTRVMDFPTSYTPLLGVICRC